MCISILLVHGSLSLKTVILKTEVEKFTENSNTVTQVSLRKLENEQYLNNFRMAKDHVMFRPGMTRPSPVS